MEYAIVQTSGKQFLVKPGHWYDIDLIKMGKIGDFVCLNKICLLRKEGKMQFGTPWLKTSSIFGKIIQQVKSKKITILKTKPKKHYTRTQGHRQLYTRILIDYFN